MADETNKDSGKYIDILDIWANKENSSEINIEDIPGMTKQFTAEEFNGIVRALKSLYSALDKNEYYTNEIVDVFTGNTSDRNITAKKGETIKLSFFYYSRQRTGISGQNRIRYEDIADFTITAKKKGSSDAPIMIYDTKDVEGDGTMVHKPIKSDTSFEIEVQDFLSGGKYEILVSGTNITEGYPVSDDTTSVSPNFNFYYNVTMTDMELSFTDEDWWLTPYTYVAGENTTMSVSLNVKGSGNRRVVVKTSGTGLVTKEYTQSVSVGMTSIVFSNIELPNSDKVMTVTAYMQSVDDESVKTDDISRNCMVTKANPTNRTVKLMAINNFKDNVTGGKSEELFSYAVYDSTSTDGKMNVIFSMEIQKDGKTETKTISQNDIALGSRTSFTYDLGTISAESMTYTLGISAKDAKTSRTMMTKRTITVNNKTDYSPVANASWYLNPVGKTNYDTTNRMFIENKMNGDLHTATWNNFSFPSPNADGNVSDGWGSQTLVEYGEEYTLPYLRVPSGSSVNIDYKPLALGTSGLRSIEFDYKITNVSDYEIPAIQIVSNNSNKTGIKIFPGKVCVATESLSDRSSQQIATDDGVRIRVVITFSRNHTIIEPDNKEKGVYNLIRIYINGIVAKVFSIASSDNINVNENLIIGSEGSDIDLYAIRVYPSSLPNEGVVMNYINRLGTSAEKDSVLADNDIYLDKEAKTGVGFENTVDQYNVFVYEGTNWPSKSNQTEGDATGILELYSVKNIGGLANADGKGQSFRITNVTAKGQGTSAMDYAEFNIQFKTTDNTSYTYLSNVDGKWIEGETVPEKKIPMFNGVPVTNAITMKKNWASSSQDHKMGSVNSYTEIWKSLGLSNAATALDPKVRVSVYQEPMLGFYRRKNAGGEIIYEYKGLFTGGPHKGDKQCFGYDSKTWPGLISIEGAGNFVPFAQFQVPWLKGDRIHVNYNADKETITFNSEEAWDYNFGKEEESEKILDTFDNTFHDPYKIAFLCSQALSAYEGSEDELKSAALANTIKPNHCYWTSNYILYYVNNSYEVEKVIMNTEEGEINLLTQLGDIVYDYYFREDGGTRVFTLNSSTTVSNAITTALTASEKNEIFKKARAVKFRNEAPEWWDIDDAIFHHCWIEFFAGTDQRAKNTYPYSFQEYGEDGKLTQNGKWKWRLDDADTIGPINNSGIISKPAYVEVHDKDEHDKYYWNGEDNVFWNLIEEAYKDRYYSIMRSLLTAMASYGNNVNTGSVSDQLYEFYNRFFLSIKNYFPEVLYNSDAERYENSWKNNIGSSSIALSQSLGNAYSPESAWYKKRIDYISSKYCFGDFAAQNGFKSRINSGVDIKATLVTTLYPTASVDTTFKYSNKRHKAGEEFNIKFDSAVDLSFFIAGPKYYSSLGDLSNIVFTENSIPFNKFTSLKELHLGNPDPSLTKTVSTGIYLPTSAKTIYLENCNSLSMIHNLNSCTKLQELNAVGTNIAQFDFASGAPLKTLKFPSTLRNIKFLNCTYLKEENITFSSLDQIKTVYINNTPGIDSIKLISDIISAQKKASNNVFKYINVQGVNQTYTGTPSVEVLELLGELTTGDYKGINTTNGADDDSKKPVISGTIGVEFAYEDTKLALEEYFEGHLKINVGDYYIRFKDDIVREKMEELMISWGWIKEGEIITVSKSENVSTLRKSGSEVSIISSALITSFDELKYFTNYTTVQTKLVDGNYMGDFSGQINMTSVALDNIVSLQKASFSGCTKLERVNLPKLTQIEDGVTGSWGAFSGCTSLKEVTSLGSIRTVSSYTFSGCTSLEKVNLHEGITSIGQKAFENCSSLKEIVIPSTVDSVASDSFVGTGLVTIYWNTTGANVSSATAFGPNAGLNGSLVIYVPKKFYDGVQAGSYGGGWSDLKSNLVAYDFDKNSVV